MIWRGLVLLLLAGCTREAPQGVAVPPPVRQVPIEKPLPKELGRLLKDFWDGHAATAVRHYAEKVPVLVLRRNLRSGPIDTVSLCAPGSELPCKSGVALRWSREDSERGQATGWQTLAPMTEDEFALVEDQGIFTAQILLLQAGGAAYLTRCNGRWPFENLVEPERAAGVLLSLLLLKHVHLLRWEDQPLERPIEHPVLDSLKQIKGRPVSPKGFMKRIYTGYK